MSAVSALSTALSGLAVPKRRMNTVGQNLANANPPGYSRQRVELSSVAASRASSSHTGTSGLRGGVQIDSVRRIRAAFLESSRVSASSALAALGAQAGALAGTGRLLAEPREMSVHYLVDSFFASWHAAATSPTDPSTGAVVIQRGIALANQLNTVSKGLAAQWSSSHEQLAGVVAQANQAASDLAALNAAILQGRSVDQPVNELIDQRDQLVRTLGELVGATAMPSEDGTVSVTVGGIMVVAEGHAVPLTLTGGTAISAVSPPSSDPPVIRWGNVAVPVDAGEAAGLLAALRTDLPAVSASVDGVAVALRDAVNLLHGGGYTLDGTPGGDFFTGEGAADLAVVPTSGTQIAVSASAGDADGSNAAAIGDLSLDAIAAEVLDQIGGGAGPSVRWRDLTSALGVKVQGLQRAEAVQESVLAAADDAGESDAGVNLDEEMTNMLLWQRAHQAAARVITTVDEMLDTLVNRTG